MNVYAHAKDAFDERAEQLGELFAVPAAIAVQNAQILAQTRRLAAHLQAALAKSVGHRSGDRDSDEPHRADHGAGVGPAAGAEPTGTYESGRRQNRTGGGAKSTEPARNAFAAGR